MDKKTVGGVVNKPGDHSKIEAAQITAHESRPGYNADLNLPRDKGLSHYPPAANIDERYISTTPLKETLVFSNPDRHARSPDTAVGHNQPFPLGVSRVTTKKKEKERQKDSRAVKAIYPPLPSL
jgi:hypothetical protein